MDDIRLAVNCASPDIVANEIARAMEIEFETRDSDYWGPYWTELPNRMLKVFSNRDPLFDPTADEPEDMYFQPQFPDHAVLVDVEQDETLSVQITRLILSVFPGSQIVGE